MGYAISCGHELTAEAADHILRLGGTAIDAAIAAFTTSWIVEPCMSGPGGGAFATVLHEDKVFCLDAFANTPKSKRPAKDTQLIPVEVDFGNAVDLFYTGYGSCAIPGAIKGIFELHKLGGSIPMKQLMEHAIHCAKQGAKLNPFQHYDLFLLSEIIKQSERGTEIFFRNGKLAEIGSIILMPNLADFLDYVSREGPDAFYQGEVAHSIASDSDQNGGNITIEDLQSYQPNLSKPRKIKVQDHQLFTQDIPSVGGKMLRDFIGYLDHDGTYSSLSVLNSLQYLRQRKKQGYYDVDRLITGGLKSGGTSHLNVIDSKGNAVSMSMSIGEGSGCMVRGTDIHMNNMLGEESLLPNGIHTWVENSRMASMMSPCLLTNSSHNSVIALGSGGASRIPTMIGQVIYHMTSGQMNIKDAVEYPRVHLHNEKWEVEPDFSKGVVFNLENWNVWNEQSLYFGGVHGASKSDDQFRAHGDQRRDGVHIISVT